MRKVLVTGSQTALCLLHNAQVAVKRPLNARWAAICKVCTRAPFQLHTGGTDDIQGELCCAVQLLLLMTTIFTCDFYVTRRDSGAVTDIS